MNRKLTLVDVASVYYSVTDCFNDEVKNKRYKNLQEAKRVANIHNGKVNKVTKRILETMEIEEVREVIEEDKELVLT